MVGCTKQCYYDLPRYAVPMDINKPWYDCLLQNAHLRISKT